MASSSATEIRASSPNAFFDALFILHRGIEREYLPLAWPSHMQEVLVFTEVVGGLGDIAAAAKAIAVMQRMSPNLHFDWALPITKYCCDPLSFLQCDDPSKVRCREWGTSYDENTPADFLLTGPVKHMWGLDYTKRHHRREIKGPHLNFSEIGGEYQVCHPKMSAKIEQLSSEASGMQTSAAKEMQTYVDIMHPKFFPSDCRYCSEGYLPMGLQPSDGVLLDQSRLKAPLSHGYYCPSYLLKIEAASLRRSILEAMATPDDGQSLPNTDNTSFNAGYAHHRSSWEKFILSVAIHEKRKDVVIVLNQRGEFIDLNCAQFQEQVLHSGLLALLKEKGYGNVVYDGETTGKQILQTEEGSRTLTVITRPRFTSADMKWMQLAAERLLGTGDNSALEAWCAKCILYLYEDVSNGGCKGRFLNQQVDLARQFSPALSQLLALFGGDSRLEERCLNQSLTGEKMRELEALLNDPSLADATLAFCKHICAHYSLDRVLEAALKRIAWLHCLPELAKVEANEMGEDFQTAFVSHVLHMNDESDDIVLPLPRFEEMGRKVREIVLRRDTL